MRWHLCLAEFDFQVKDKKGSANQQADALSRLRTNAENVFFDDDDEITAFLLDNSNESNVDDTELLGIDYHPLDEFLLFKKFPILTTPFSLLWSPMNPFHLNFMTVLAPKFVVV